MIETDDEQQFAHVFTWTTPAREKVAEFEARGVRRVRTVRRIVFDGRDRIPSGIVPASALAGSVGPHQIAPLPDGILRLEGENDNAAPTT